MAKQELVPTTTTAKMVVASGVDSLLSQIRPEWQAKALAALIHDVAAEGWRV